MLPNFSWYVEDFIAASAIPQTISDFKFLKKQGIVHIINLTEDKYDVVETILKPFQLHQIHIPDFTAPTLAQMDEFSQMVNLAMNAGESVLVHCHAGCGRTGTMLAAWMIASGSSAKEAIKWTRELRPCSIETNEQEQALYEYSESNVNKLE